ncbi:preprotein translocase subunit SecA [Spongorhabdus nitratireducens]
MSWTATCAPADIRHQPEKRRATEGKLDQAVAWISGRLPFIGLLQFARKKAFLRAVHRHSVCIQKTSTPDLVSGAVELGLQIRSKGFIDPLVAECFAIIRELTGRVLEMRHYDSQLLGGWVMVNGRIAEMQTGEGKTITAALPAVTAALAGIPVHVVTVNDYLTARDAESLVPLYQLFNLSVGVITHEVEHGNRCEQYQSDILYITGKELVFDYLRDRMQQPRASSLQKHAAYLTGKSVESELLQRGLHFAIVDEADSVLIDESRTPLIISGSQSNEEEQTFIRQAWDLAQHLNQTEHFQIVPRTKQIELTESGQKQLEQQVKQLVESLGDQPVAILWRGSVRREEIIKKALSARFLFEKDRDYLIREGKVELVDPLTGRVMEGRSWERGLHQMVELKEECELTDQRTTLIKMSYQRFFQRYFHLAGMTGTATEVCRELWDVYGLRVSIVAPNRKNRRQHLPFQIYPDADSQWQAITASVKQQVQAGRAVLIGTHSVAASEQASQVLHIAKICHQVLNARQDETEADIVAAAGQPGRVTIATNMAGRGTDIKLATSVKDAGGLHVILTEHYESGRVDRQLEGRCARQGDPGSFEMILTTEELKLDSLPIKACLQIIRLCGYSSLPGKYAAKYILRMQQKQTEQDNYFARKATFKHDTSQSDALAFAGQSE